ncbi:3'-5' exonuclease [Candidatus Woesearchaeota archaeon]|nr:3'-5' exonuclease [Candidatus Woesearchaeota archaeon]
MSKDFVVVDIETTGLYPYLHKITEISAIRYKNYRIREEFTTLVNPERHIPLFITNLTGITDRMVKDAPLIHKVMPKFLDFLGGRTLVGHNAWFDFKFLEHNSMKYLRKGMENDVLCTCKLARRLVPYLYSKRLNVICNHLGIKNINAHRARGDALATTQILEKFLFMLEKRGVKEHEAILRFQKTRIPKLSYIRDVY